AAGADGEPAALPGDRAEVAAVGVLDGPAHLGTGQVGDDELAGVAVELDAPPPDLEPQHVHRGPGARAATAVAAGLIPATLPIPASPPVGPRTTRTTAPFVAGTTPPLTAAGTTAPFTPGTTAGTTAPLTAGTAATAFPSRT